MNYKINLKALAFLSIFLPIMGNAIAEELLTDQDLYSEAKAQSTVSAKGKKGPVTIIEKQGFWVKVKSGDSSGWTKLSNIKASSSGGIGLPDTGRSSSGNIVSTSGVRGLDGGDLINAKPDFAEFSKLASLKLGKEQGAAFAKDGGLETRKINYVAQSAK